jgi:hypothetical protein
MMALTVAAVMAGCGTAPSPLSPTATMVAPALAGGAPPPSAIPLPTGAATPTPRPTASVTPTPVPARTPALTPTSSPTAPPQTIGLEGFDDPTGRSWELWDAHSISGAGVDPRRPRLTFWSRRLPAGREGSPVVAALPRLTQPVQGDFAIETRVAGVACALAGVVVDDESGTTAMLAYQPATGGSLVLAGYRTGQAPW